VSDSLKASFHAYLKTELSRSATTENVLASPSKVAVKDEVDIVDEIDDDVALIHEGVEMGGKCSASNKLWPMNPVKTEQLNAQAPSTIGGQTGTKSSSSKVNIMVTTAQQPDTKPKVVGKRARKIPLKYQQFQTTIIGHPRDCLEQEEGEENSNDDITWDPHYENVMSPIVEDKLSCDDTNTALLTKLASSTSNNQLPVELENVVDSKSIVEATTIGNGSEVAVKRRKRGRPKSGDSSTSTNKTTPGVNAAGRVIKKRKLYGPMRKQITPKRIRLNKSPEQSSYQSRFDKENLQRDGRSQYFNPSQNSMHRLKQMRKKMKSIVKSEVKLEGDDCISDDIGSGGSSVRSRKKSGPTKRDKKKNGSISKPKLTTNKVSGATSGDLTTNGVVKLNGHHINGTPKDVIEYKCPIKKCGWTCSEVELQKGPAVLHLLRIHGIQPMDMQARGLKFVLC